MTTTTASTMKHPMKRPETPGAFFDRVLLIGPASQVFDALRQIRLDAERSGAPVPAITSAPGWDGRAPSKP